MPFSYSPLQSTIFLLSIWVIYSVGVALYRLYFSPLQKFPGPRLAALTYLYEFYYDIYKNGQFHFHLRDLHDRYGRIWNVPKFVDEIIDTVLGPIVRVNPTELHIDDPDYWDKLYSRDGKWDKSPRYCAQFGTTEAEVFTVRHDIHRARRTALNPFFSKQKVNAMEPILQSQVDRMCERIAGYRGKGESLPIRLCYTCLTIAITCEFTFGQNYGVLEMDGWGVSSAETTQEAWKGVHWARLFPFLSRIENAVPNWLIIWLASKSEETIAFARILEVSAPCSD